MLPELQQAINARRRIYLLRHAEVRYFDPDGRPFQVDDVCLTPDGIAQAEAAAQVLRNVPIDRIITSGLPRTVQTGEIIARGRDLDLEVREGFREIVPGRLIDLGDEPGQLQREFLGALGEGLTRDSRFLGGETFGSLQDRVLPVLTALMAETNWSQLAVVAHGGVNRAILAHTMGLGLDGIGRFEQDPACINVIDVDSDGRFLIRLLNYTPYCPAKDAIEMTTMEKLYFEYRARDEGGTTT